MIDIELLRKNSEIFKTGCKNKNASVDVDAVLEMDKKWRETLKEVEDLRAKQNSLGEGVASEKDETKKKEVLAELKEVKIRLKKKKNRKKF